MSKLSPLASVSSTREVLQAHGLATKKALGQHFLINDGVISKICDLSGVASEDIVLEVGPGIGTLTIALLKKAGIVVSVERDTDLPHVLADTCRDYADSFTLIEKDALDLTEDDIRSALFLLSLQSQGLQREDGEDERGNAETQTNQASGKEKSVSLPSLFIANLPYAVAATIILDYFERFDSLKSATVMIQSEVADRICAKPGTKAYGAYTVKLSLYAQPAGRFTVGPGNFFPPPRVDSAVVRLDRINLCDTEGTLVEETVRKAACTMADAAFATRRKTLSNSCKTYFAAQGEEGEAIIAHLPEIFQMANVDPSLRGEALSREEFIALGKALVETRQEQMPH